MCRAQQKSEGYTIITVLVGMAISLFLLAGILTIYVNSKSSFGYQAALAAATENGRFAVDDLSRPLYMTGRGLLASQPAFPDVGTDLYDGSGGASDGLSVIYASGVDCQGNTITDNSPHQQNFMVEPDDEGNNALKCSVDAGDKETLASGVEWMQVLYGVDDDADGAANMYQSATEVSTADAWNNVVSLRIGLVISSGEFTVPASARGLTPDQIDLLGATFTPTDDSRLYKTFITTILLRNLAMVER